MSLSIRAIRRNDFAEAERYARKAVALDPELYAPRSILGEALVIQAAPKAHRNVWGRAPNRNVEKLNEAVLMLDHAVSLARSQHLHTFLAEALILRAQAHVLERKFDDADDDFRSAIQVTPESAVTRRRYANFLYFTKEQPAEAVFQLRKAISLGDGLMSEHFLAGILSESNKPSDRNEAADIFVRLTRTWRADPPTADDQSARNHRSLGIAGFQSAIELLVDAQRFDDAENLIGEVSEGRFSELTILTARSAVAVSRGDANSATSLAEEAFLLVTDDSPEHDVRALALQLGRLRLWEWTLTLWMKIHEKVGIGSDAHRLIFCAKQLNRFDVIINIAKVVREGGMADMWIRYQEIQALEHFDVEEAISLLQEMVTTEPNEHHVRWNLSYLGLRWLRPELIDPRPEALTPVEDATPEEGFLAVEIMRRYGDPNVVLRYAYELVRRHPNKPDAHCAFSCLFHMPGSRRPTVDEPAEALPGTAVCMTENGQERWVIIEDSPNPRSAFNEVSPKSKIAHSLLHKRVHEEIIISEGSARPRTAVIKEIISKYTYLFRDILTHWQIRFNEHKYIQAFTITRPDPETGEPVHDFSDIKLVVDKQLEHIKEIKSAYDTSFISLDNYAGLVGVSPFQAVCYLASNP